MPEQELDGAQVGAGLKQMDGERMAEQMRRNRFGESRALGGAPAGKEDRPARGVSGRVPGKSQRRGRSTCHRWRRTASSFGESIT